MAYVSFIIMMGLNFMGILIMVKRMVKVFFFNSLQLKGNFKTKNYTYTGEWKEDLMEGKGKIEIKTNYGIYIYDDLWIQDKPKSFFLFI